MSSKPGEIEYLEEAIKKLRIAYEKYFAGVERLEPLKEKERVKALMRQLRAEPTPNTARRYRIQQLQATLVTHETYWNRICRQIEEGTFRRDRLKAKKRLEALAAANAAGDSAGPPAARKAAAKGAAGDDDFSPTLKKLHTAFNQAQRDAGAKGQVSMKALAQTVAAQTATLKAKYNCRDVEFRVAVKDGKAILKAIPK